MSYLSRSLSLSRQAWAVGRQLAGVETQHPVLTLPFVPLNDPDGSGPRLIAEACAELDRAMLGQGQRMRGEFVDILRLLAAPAVQVYGWVGLHNRVEIGVVAASDGRSAVRAMLDPSGMHLTPIDADKLVESVVELLPRYWPSSARSVTVPRDAYEGVTDGGAGAGRLKVDVLPSDRVRRDVVTFKGLLAQRRRGGGRFYVATRDRMGRSARSERPLTYLDLESGRMVFREKPNSGGETWLIAVPADPRSIANDLYTMFDQL